MRPIVDILKIIEVTGHSVTCVFSNGEYRSIDLSKLLDQWKPGKDDLTAELYDVEKVGKVVVENGTLTWPAITMDVKLLDEIVTVALDIDPMVLYENSVIDKNHDSAYTLGRQLKQARISAGLTQEALANRVGTSKSYISKIESSKSDIGYKTLRKIVEVGLGKRLEIVD
ncbi:DNA-binding XRE family transcriptional regulator [Lewinella aquimaris]|uniref:DNA-binding XRE family transcriptional regulator n=1 Tax=Neolewinella aquimaris TaxID=1835722 RepID=A0A840E8B6_9BACT|nr:helix-turn-helix transcriptional regulator [Neolewinella aquimaris]MBB4078029.1 DNA-binding XRE family transcriptional regulator [Neolewinella aquimaris]